MLCLHALLYIILWYVFLASSRTLAFSYLHSSCQKRTLVQVSVVFSDRASRAPKSKRDAVRAALTCHAHEQWERPKGDRDSEGSATIRDRDGNCVGGTHEWSAIDDRAWWIYNILFVLTRFWMPLASSEGAGAWRCTTTLPCLRGKYGARDATNIFGNLIWWGWVRGWNLSSQPAGAIIWHWQCKKPKGHPRGRRRGAIAMGCRCRLAFYRPTGVDTKDAEM